MEIPFYVPYIVSLVVFLTVYLCFHLIFTYPYDKHEVVERTESFKPIVNKNRIVFTMTTIPSRLGFVRDVIDNLLSLSVKPDAIYLNLPDFSVREGVAYVVPDSLKDLDSRVIINTGVFDHGPATKLIPTLSKEKEPNTIIIPVDDDAEFPYQYFEELIAYSMRYPNTVWGYHGVKVYEGDWWIAQTNTIDPVDIVETSCGVVYRRFMFSDKLDVPTDHVCRLQDDFIFGEHVASNGFARMILPSDIDRTSTKGRFGMPMKHKFELPNPLYLVNFNKEGNSKCSELMSDSFFMNKKYSVS